MRDTAKAALYHKRFNKLGLGGSEAQTFLCQFELDQWINALDTFLRLLFPLGRDQAILDHRLSGVEGFSTDALDWHNAPFVKGLDGNSEASGHLALVEPATLLLGLIARHDETTTLTRKSIIRSGRTGLELPS